MAKSETKKSKNKNKNLMTDSKKIAEEISNAPKVSVILSSYNHEKYVAESVQSVLNQTFTDFELLIFDDGSKDNSREIIKKFDDPRIKFFLHEVNRGPNICFKECIFSAKGKYIAIHHSDDSWEKNKLEKQVEFLDAHEEYAACFTWANFIDEDGNLNELDDGDFYKKVFEKDNRSRAEWLNYFFYNANCICHPSILIHSEAYEKYKLTTDTQGLWQLPDLFMWIRLCFSANFYIMPERLVNFRLRRKTQENVSASTYDKTIRADFEFYLIAKEFEKNFSDEKFFLDVFPETKNFVVDGEINIKFAFAQLCLKKNVAAFQMAGLEILKELLSDSKSAEQIKKLYDYDEKNFLLDTGKYDVFNLIQKLSMLNSSIYYDTGNDFNSSEEIKQNIYVDHAGDFFTKFNFTVDKPIKFIRFDPNDTFSSIALEKCKINGKNYSVSRHNASEIFDGFYRFMTSDPQFIFATENLSGNISIEINGKVEKNYFGILTDAIQKIKSNVVELENLNAQLEREKSAAEHEIDILKAEKAYLISQNSELNRINTEMLNSNSWKITEPLRDLGRWSRYDNKDKALAVARLFYKAIPFGEDTKEGLKDKFYTNFEPLLKNTQRYKNWVVTRERQRYELEQQNSIIGSRVYKFNGELLEQPGKIAIQAHIFYLDLVDEIAKYFSNMPYKFDALISIIDPSAEEKIKSAFGKIKNVENLIVRVVPNRGRDVAPFIVGFGDILGNYEFIAHIHSKKSLYTGSEQQKWRHYLFDSLLGSPSLIRKIFKSFHENKNLGLIYPKPAENVPYAAFTWLSNKSVGMYLLNLIHVPPNVTDYFDFPAGTMFWARSKALQKCFSSLTVEDFPEEQGQNDGTIAHAFERVVALTAASEKMDFYEFDPEKETYTVNIGNKNLWQYYGRSDIELQWVLEHGKIISFDLFDTLLMRYIAKPSLVNELIRLKVEDLLEREFDFPKIRLEAEKVAREKKSADVNLDEIYESFSELSGLDKETCKKIRELEVSTEVEIALPRAEVLEWFNKILSVGRKIWLISDMYMQTPDIKRILEKCGIRNYEKLMISCETGMRKDTAEVWNKLVETGFANGMLCHLGDNEMSDVQFVGDRNIGAYHIMSAINLFSQTPCGRMFLNSVGKNMSLFNGMLFGMILAKKFHSPFELRNLGDGGGKLILKNFRDFGYWFYGIPVLTFMLWLIKKSEEDNRDRILFLARDGYFLQPLYKFITKLLKIDSLKSDYFYASRRAVTVASIKNISHAYEMLNLRFEGTVKKFFAVRFNIAVDDDREINLPEEEKDVIYVKSVIDKYADKILKRAEGERKNYEKYIDSLGGNFDNAGVVDMGYSGTIQHHLQRIMNKNFKGYYFATSAKNLFGDNAAEMLRGCFTENDDFQRTKSSIYKYQLVFESILTAPDAQLQYFDSEGKPIFGNPEPAQMCIEEIREVHEGIKDFCGDVIEHFGKYILRVPIDFYFVDAWVRSLIQDGNIIAPEIKKIFAFDDEFCNTFTGNAWDLYLENMGV